MLGFGIRTGNHVGGADNTIVRRDTNSALPHPHHVVGDVARDGPLVLLAVGHHLLALQLIHVADAHAGLERHLKDRQVAVAGLIALCEQPTIPANLPMRRNLPKPRQAGVLVFGIGSQIAVMPCAPRCDDLLQQSFALGLEGLQGRP